MNDLSSDIDWVKAKKAYDHGLTDSEIAEMLHISKSTVRSKRNRAKWGKANRSQKRNKSIATGKKRCNVAKRDAELSNSSANTNSKLNDRQRLFCEEYAVSFNATQAYINAYNCKLSTAQVSAHDLLRNPKVKMYIDSIKERNAERIGAHQDYVLRKLIQMFNAKFTDYISYQTYRMPDNDENGNQRVDADGNAVFYYKNVYHLKTDADWTLVGMPSQGKDGINIPITDKLSIAKELLNRLPEAVSDKPQENTFLHALSESKKAFDEDNDEDTENEDKNS